MDGTWCWPKGRTRDHRVESIIQALADECLPLLQEEDMYRWKCEKSGTYMTTSSVELLGSRSIEVSWAKLVWFKGHIPRYAFIMWLLCRNRLTTKDRLLRIHRISKERNNRIFRRKTTAAEQIINDIILEIRRIVAGWSRVPRTKENWGLCID